jgi:fermentation-respiration switch protein FrsA (DUF1100 family)
MSEAEVKELLHGPAVANARDRKGDGGAFYQHCRQKGVWPFMVSDLDPLTQSDMFTPFMPVQNVTPDYPPTFLIHGTEDTDVPYEQSLLMAREFEAHGVPHVLRTVEGGEHGLAGAAPEEVNKAYEAALRFLNEYMNDGI